MKKIHIALKYTAIITLLLSLLIACDKDFASIDSDIINNDNAVHFKTDIIRFNVITYNNKLGPVQTNNLPLNFLGIYNDALYGTTKASVVTQLTPSAYGPSFGEGVVLDSVVLTLPYFSTSQEVKEDGETIYELDSVFGTSPIKLSIFENNYFLRDFDPNLGLNTPQKYYSNGSTGTELINPSLLEGRLLTEITDFLPSEKEIKLLDSTGLVTRVAPSLRLKLDTAFWQEKILDKEGDVKLSNANNFKNYFRGLYFKAESIGIDGNALLINFGDANANVVMYYTKTSESGGRESGTYSFAFGDKRVNFISEFDLAIPDGNETAGDEKLYLKGGQGSVAVIDLFNGIIQDPETGLNMSQLDYFKSKKGKWLINEANLVFYVDQASVTGLKEPDRIYIYDIENGTPLVDYYGDIDNNITPINSKIFHLGKLERVGDEPNGQGIKYRIKITEHINNILLRDSTNVKLGLAVSANVNIENTNTQQTVLTTNNLVNKAPLSSIMTPLGTVIIGNNTSNEQKKVSLEIFYTEPKNN